MAELDKMEEMEKALGAGVMMRSSAEQTGPAEEPKAQTEEFTRKFFLKTSGGAMVDLLDTNPLVMVASAEMRGYSITPQTFQSRTFFSDEEPSGDEEKESLAGLSSSDTRAAEEPIHPPRSLTYVDEFAFGSNAVVRFGINSRNVAVDNERQTLEGESVSFYDPQLQETSSQSTAAIKKLAISIDHHFLEIQVATEAVRHLFTEKSINTVLVDIFARINGKIKILENGAVETHTVLLYKNPPVEGKHQILVIDPSNFSFSSHLSNLNERLKSEFGNLENIVTLHKNLQLYKSNGEEVPYFHLYRDCIDVAAKLAFNFNTPSDHLHVDLMRIVEYAPIKAISNIPKIDKTILDTDIPTRIKQTSNVEVVHQFNTIEKVLGRNFQILRRLDEATHDKSRYDHTELLKTSDTMQTIIGKLAVQNQIVITCISDNLNSEQGEIMELIGDIT